MPSSDPQTAFDDLADRYEALVNWPRRLANETPFYRRLFEQTGTERVLDTACGTGQHAQMFHSWGLQVEGADASPAMIDRCRAIHGEPKGLRWVVRSFDLPPDAPGTFDAVLCVGNSLALANDARMAQRSLAAMVAAVRRGGVGVVHVLNIWHLPDGPTVWQKCERVTIGGARRILIKGIHRVGARGWIDLVDVAPDRPDKSEDRFHSTALLGFEADDLAGAVRNAGAEVIGLHGDYQEQPYVREGSSDLIVVWRRR